MDKLINGIVNPLDKILQMKIQKRLDDLTKPVGSLGYLETLAMQYCLCRNDENASINKKMLYVFAGDHGITDEGVAPYPKGVTIQMVNNILNGGAAVSVMCQTANVWYNVVNMGIDGIIEDHPKYLSYPVASCTQNFSKMAAMSKGQCLKALNTGCSIAFLTECDLYAIGEMGIGNTTSASALASLLLKEDPQETVGMGTGANGYVLNKKCDVIVKSVMLHQEKWDGSAFDALRRLGGFEIAGMAGFILGCAKKRVPVIIDGFIATVSALCALKMNPVAKEYMIFGHVSNEQYHSKLLQKMNARPLLSLDMRLGEGTGAVLAMHIVEQAMACYNKMATFSSAGVSNRSD
ncbi:MAG: nicotinate-nucleotide--dimethylbenzimidazole phosphoribosyltransferase [Fibrobacter sp.]|nr:nicotinate-nucleotide--dimethylbenzimidazole phosphoribosyltransferase [Fibrobacter sp.]